MNSLSDKSLSLAERLEARCKEWKLSKLVLGLEKLREAAKEIGKSWSGSWIGYHSRVYYANFQLPPTGTHFSSSTGFETGWGTRDETRGEWVEYQYDAVHKSIFTLAKLKDANSVTELSDQVEDDFETIKSELISTLTLANPSSADTFLKTLQTDSEKIKPSSSGDFIETLVPKKFQTVDSKAANQGVCVPPHIRVIAQVFAIEQPAKCCEALAKICRRAASHLQLKTQHKHRDQTTGTKIFIGHGASPFWKDLKDFVCDRLQLPWDEFNRVPVAGITNIARLSQMLDEAAIAFLVMTAEDEQTDGKLRARMNVIHEAGLFQGRLGFTKAIVILEEGCEEFSNIQGLGQIRFPKGKIKAAFEEVRQVLEREGLLEPK